MPRAPKACAFPDCEERVVGRTHCPEHAATMGRFRDLRRGTPAERGYDHAHRKERQRWEPMVARGLVDCWRCGERIIPDPSQVGGGWDLGHNADRTAWLGPEHARQCNRSAAGEWSPREADDR